VNKSLNFNLAAAGMPTGKYLEELPKELQAEAVRVVVDRLLDQIADQGRVANAQESEVIGWATNALSACRFGLAMKNAEEICAAPDSDRITVAVVPIELQREGIKSAFEHALFTVKNTSLGNHPE
jgi:hypothetical protein